MAFKIFAGIVALVLLLVYLAAPVLKLKEESLAAVVVIGIAMAIVDLWQSMKSKDD